MTLITFLPHTPFKKKNVLSFLICIVISMGKVEKVNVLYKNAVYGCCVKTPRYLFQKLLSYMKIVDPMKKDLVRSPRNMVKTSKNEKVNKGRSATWWSNFTNFNGSKFVFYKAL